MMSLTLSYSYTLIIACIHGLNLVECCTVSGGHKSSFSCIQLGVTFYLVEGWVSIKAWVNHVTLGDVVHVPEYSNPPHRRKFSGQGYWHPFGSTVTVNWAVWGHLKHLGLSYTAFPGGRVSPVPVIEVSVILKPREYMWGHQNSPELLRPLSVPQTACCVWAKFVHCHPSGKALSEFFFNLEDFPFLLPSNKDLNSCEKAILHNV